MQKMPNIGTVDVFQLIGYGRYSIDESTEIQFQVDAGQNKNKLSRAILFQGTTASAAYDSLSTHLGVGVGKAYSIGDRTGLTSSLRMDYTWIEDEGYTENGANLLNLTIGKRSGELLILSMDGTLIHELSPNTTLSANVGIGYDTQNKRASITATYAGAPGASFAIQGLQQDPWIGRVGFGVTRKARKDLEISARYDAEERTRFLNQTASAKVRLEF